MNGFFLLVPFFLIRFVLLFIINKKAIRRAAHFAPVQCKEKIAYYIYQTTNAVIFLYLIFLSVKIDYSWQFYLGATLYFLGLLLCIAAIIGFSSPDNTGLNTDGIYKFSRNPMYMAYFVCFAGMALLTQSFVLFGVVLIFQISAHWIILAEERWCVQKFGMAYKRYMQEVRRYI